MTDGAEDHEPSYLQKFSRQFSRHDSEFSGVGRQFSRHDSEFSHQIKNLLDDDNKQFNGTKIPDIILTEDDRLLENNQQSHSSVHFSVSYFHKVLDWDLYFDHSVK